jgi:two-component system, sensor histidine kinase YesM
MQPEGYEGGLLVYYRTIINIEYGNCLTISTESDDEEWNLTTYISKKQLDSYLSETRTITFTVGALFILAAGLLIIVSVILLTFFIRILMRPLSILAKQLRRTGQGNFKSRISISGCSEITLLSDEYNTLQTLSAEAIENDQMKINDIVMALSSMLKYTIKGPETVTLKTELEHVRDYLFLQKARFENSIIHGMSKTADSVRIEITAAHTGGKLIITVTDDGAGIPADRADR